MERKSNCIAYFLCIIIEIFVFLSFDYIDNCGKSIFSSLLTIFLLVGIVLLILSICSLLYYYFSDDTIKDFESLLKKIGQDITHIFSWLFSVNGFLFIILTAIVALILFFMYSFSDIKEAKGKLELTALTLTISLAAIIPSIISKIIARAEIESIVDDRLKNKLEELNTSLSTILKTNAHACRMSAVLLYQIAEQHNKAKNYKIAVDNTIWSIGWASIAIKNYFLIKEEYPKAIKFSEELLKDYILESKDFLMGLENSGTSKREDDNKFVRPKARDLVSLFTMHALVRKYRFLKEIKKGDESIKTEEKLTEIEGFLLKYMEVDNIPVASDCYIQEKDNKFNKELEDVVKEIIEEAKGSRRRQEEEEAQTKATVEDSKKAEEGVQITATADDHKKEEEEEEEEAQITATAEDPQKQKRKRIK